MSFLFLARASIFFEECGTLHYYCIKFCHCLTSPLQDDIVRLDNQGLTVTQLRQVQDEAYNVSLQADREKVKFAILGFRSRLW